MHEGFVAELQSAFADLARNPAVATATQIAL
jgi:hypothetical protein